TAGRGWELPDVQGSAPTPVLKLSVAGGQDLPQVDGRLVFTGETQQQQRADLQFELPLAADQRWVLWMPRDPFNAVRVTSLDGSIQSSDFFRPAEAEGGLPVGYVFALPRESMGLQRLRLDLQGEVRSAPTPRILSERDGLRQASREVALACALYAALATLLIASLVLYPAVRDPIFLLYSGYLVIALLFVATLNGHLYAMPGTSALRELGARGFWLIMLAFNAVALLTLTRFAETRASDSSWIRRLDWVAMAMGILVLLPLLPLQVAADSLQSITTAAWLLAMPVGIVATIDGARRGVQMAVATTVAMLLLLAAAAAHEAMQRAWLGDDMLTRHGYQFVLVLVSVIMFVGLSSRIGQVRQRLLDEINARMQSDIRLGQERIQTGFAHALQDRLRGVDEDDIAAVAFRMLGEHAREVTGASAAVVVGGGYLGQDLLLVQPEGQSAGFAQSVLAARGLVRTHVFNGEPINIGLDGTPADHAAGGPLLAIIPLRLASPAWAALVVPATAPDGYEQATLSALLELAHLAGLHADEAYAAIQLRRTAERDSLTGTRNRRSLDQALAREFKAHAVEDGALAVLFIDIDRFKRINDRLGHACGDLCIRSIANTLSGELRPTDVLGRYGGDEFLVLLPGRDAAAARIIAERLRKGVDASQVHWQGEVLPLTVSIGMAARRDTDREPGTLLERADKALYAAKQEGRNRVCVAPAVFS
ncbi:MAG: diguanylate cyclase, partial [Thermomonas sp.]